MKQLIILLTALLISFPVFSADFKKGVESYDRKDYVTALKEWKPLAEQGDAEAQYNLGLMYKNGLGVPRDYVYAYMWWSIAVSGGDKTAKTNLDKVEKMMTSNQIAEAQRMAREWVAKHPSN